MKRVMTSLVLIAFFLTCFTFAQTLETVKETDPRYSFVEDNLIKGLKDENLGLRTNCAFWLGEMRSQKAVIPLMKVFRSDDDQRAQIMAAVSLTKIEDDRGVFIVRRVGEFSNDPRMKRVCERLYVGYLLNQRKATVEVEELIEAAVDQAEEFVKYSLLTK